MKIFNKQPSLIIKRWLPLAFAVSAVFVYSYILSQQYFRMVGNDAQVEIAGNIEQALSEGTTLDAFTTSHLIDMERSLTPYAIFYGIDQKPVSGNGSLDGNYPVPPKGVFEYLLTHKEDRFTWEPKKGVRQAVVARYHDGVSPVFTVVGGSLREVEKHIWQSGCITLLFWCAALVGSFLLVFATA